MSADQIVQKAVSDLEAASSVRLTGQLADAGQTRALDLTVVAGAGCRGTISYGAGASATSGAALAGTADLIVVDSTVYMKLDAGLLKSAGLPSSMVAAATGKYIKLTSKSDLATFAQVCNSSSLSGMVGSDDTGFVKSGTATIAGQPALAFKQARTAYISDSATPEIVRVAGTASQGTFDFSDYNAPATITAPPAGDVIDGSELGL
jgi:hypothetical protein